MEFEQLLDPALISTCLIPWGQRIISALAIFVIGRWIMEMPVRNGIGIPCPQQDVHLHNVA